MCSFFSLIHEEHYAIYRLKVISQSKQGIGIKIPTFIEISMSLEDKLNAIEAWMKELDEEVSQDDVKALTPEGIDLILRYASRM